MRYSSGELEVSELSIVALSCRSGRQDITVAVNEAVGLGAAFVAAGAGSVLTNQWLAPDLASAIFTYLFFRYLLQGFDTLDALEYTKRDFQEKTVEDLGLIGILQNFIDQSGQSPELLHALNYYKKNRNLRPFQSPHYWAGYSLCGIPLSLDV